MKAKIFWMTVGILWVCAVAFYAGFAFCEHITPECKQLKEMGAIE